MALGVRRQILIADDDPTSRMILVRLLSQWGFDAVACTGGTEALRLLLGDDPPRIALLDWVMPGLSGPDVCRRLAERDSGPFIYTMLLTGKTEDTARIAGLQAGASQYLRKPCDPLELRSCIEVGVRVLTYEQTLADQNTLLSRYATQMEALAEERARQLLHADRMMTLGIMAAGIVHEVNNSMSLVAGNTQTLARFLPIIEAALDAYIATATDATAQHQYVRDELPALLEGIRKGVSRVGATIRGLQGYSRRSDAVKRPCNLNTCVQEALAFCQHPLAQFEVRLDLCASPPLFNGVAGEIHQVLVNLLINAGHAMEDDGSKPGILHVRTHMDGGWIQFVCEDSGTGLSEAVLADIWKPFFTTKPAGRGTGLGLSICQGLIENHGGRIEAANAPSGGARFTVYLPAAEGPLARLEIEEREAT